MSISYFDHESLQRWFRDNGDRTHRINYDLDRDSIVFDLGGFEGSWSADIFEKYECEIYIFEPVKKYFDKIVGRFENNPKIHIFNLGLSNKNGTYSIYYNNDSSSLVHKTSETLGMESIQLKNICDFIDEINIEKIDLIKINIEGEEFDLLDEIINRSYQSKFSNIQVQFHKMFDDCYQRRDNIRKSLSETHYTTYDYTFVWENWSRTDTTPATGTP